MLGSETAHESLGWTPFQLNDLAIHLGGDVQLPELDVAGSIPPSPALIFKSLPAQRILAFPLVSKKNIPRLGQARCLREAKRGGLCIQQYPRKVPCP